MDDIHTEDDWETEEFQNALKVVLKCEIQSLLERLSETGEETVLLTANTTDLCVGHLSSSNAQKFVDSDDVGNIKNKFLYFLTVGIGNQTGTKVCKVIQPQQKPGTRQVAGRGRGGTTGPGFYPNPRANSTPSHSGKTAFGTASRGRGGHTAAGRGNSSDLDCGTLSDSEVSRKLDTNWSNPSTPVKTPGKRPNDSSLTSNEQYSADAVDAKRRKTESHPQFRKGISVSQINPSVNSPATLAKSPSLPHVISLSDEDSYNMEKKLTKPPVTKSPDVKLTTTKVVSKSGGFTEEKISNAEFQKFLQRYKDDDDPEEYPYDESEEEELEEGEIGYLQEGIHLQHNPQQGLRQQQLQEKLFQQNQNLMPPSAVSKQTGVVNKLDKPAIIRQVASPSVNQAGKADPHVGEKKTEAEREGYDGAPAPLPNKNNAYLQGEDGGAVSKKVTVQNSGKPNLEKKLPEIKTADVTDINQVPEIKEELDPNDTEYKKPESSLSKPAAVVNDKTEAGSTPKDKINQEKDKSKEVLAKMNEIGPTKQQKFPQTSTSQRNERFGSDDDIDTETLIQMTKDRHMENMSEADKQIQARLGQLSSKLSWVVEYPKEYDGAGPMQPPYPSLAAGGMYHGEGDEEEEGPDEEDEDYDEDDYGDDVGLDEEDMAQLRAAHLAKMARNAPGNHGDGGDMGEGNMVMNRRFQGHMGVMVGEDYDGEEFEGMEEGEYGEYGEYNSEDELDMEGMEEGEEGHMRMANQGLMGYGQMQMAQPPSIEDNFIPMGTMFSKCLICNKLVRKTEQKQHSMTHMEEEEGEEEDDEEEQCGNLHDAGQMLGSEEFHGEHEEALDSGEILDTGEEYDEEQEDTAEFTAEPLVAERLVPEKVSDKPPKNTVCDICDKSFKSMSNMQRHRKIHTDSKDFICPVCQKDFRLLHYMLKHIKNKHPDYTHTNTPPQSAASGMTKDTDSFKCGLCSEVFSEEELLLEHLKIHV